MGLLKGAGVNTLSHTKTLASYWPDGGREEGSKLVAICCVALGPIDIVCHWRNCVVPPLSRSSTRTAAGWIESERFVSVTAIMASLPADRQSARGNPAGSASMTLFISTGQGLWAKADDIMAGIKKMKKMVLQAHAPANHA
jgi:hypothetical protein